MFVLEMVIVLHQIVVVVPMVMLVLNVNQPKVQLNIQFVLEFLQIIQMFVLEMVIVLQQIVVVVPVIMLEQIVNFQCVLEFLQIMQMFVQMVVEIVQILTIVNVYLLSMETNVKISAFHQASTYLFYLFYYF